MEHPNQQPRQMMNPGYWGNQQDFDVSSQFHSMRLEPSWNVNAAEFVPRPPHPHQRMSQGMEYGHQQQPYPSNMPYEYQNGPGSSTGSNNMYYNNGAGQNQQQMMNGFGDFADFGGGAGGGGMPSFSWMDHLLAPYAAQGDQPKVQFFLEIQVGIEQIIQEPEKFQDFAEAIRDRILTEDGVGPEVLDTVASIIVNMTLSCYNVTYPMGKLCAYLCEEMDCLPSDAPPRGFKAQLLHICRLVHEDRFTLLEVESERLRRFALFMAELFTQMKTQDGSRLNILGKAMLDLLATLMTRLPGQEPITEQNLKSVIRILKCCGSSLESMSEEEKYIVNSTIVQLQNLKDEAAISPNTKKAIEDLAALQKNGWHSSGGTSSYDQSQNGTKVSLREDYLNPVMFGPDGTQLTEEESAFLNEHLGRQDSTATSNGDDDLFKQ